MVKKRKLKVRELSKSELTILIYLMMKGMKRAKELSTQLEIDISYVYKILNTLEQKNLIIKIYGKNDIEYKATEELIV